MAFLLSLPDFPSIVSVPYPSLNHCVKGQVSRPLTAFFTMPTLPHCFLVSAHPATLLWSPCWSPEMSGTLHSYPGPGVYTVPPFSFGLELPPHGGNPSI